MKILPFIGLLMLSTLSISQSFKRCASTELLHELRQDSSFIRAQKQFEAELQRSAGQKTETIFLIPVVVHVVYKNSLENISETQILSQLDILNEDFRKRNADTSIVEPEFSIADVKIEFCLAKRDPQGNVSSGINRIQTQEDDIGTRERYYAIQPAWDPDHYLNIWVGDYGTDGSGNDILGRASAPGDPITARDGIFVSYKAFGSTGTATAPYDGGRTATHELGHWLNLYHIWGVNGGCGDDDLVADTPDQISPYYNCPVSPAISCGSKDMLSNFMGYVDDDCMGNFTIGQKERMRAALVNLRTSLLLSKGCLPVGLDENHLSRSIKVYPNPIQGQLNIQRSQPEIEGELNFELYDLNGKRVKQFSMHSNRNELEIEMNDYPSGIYLLRLISKQDQHTFKLLLQH